MKLSDFNVIETQSIYTLFAVESVHTTRYRLRKKLEIKTGADLTDFMDKF